MCQSLKIKFPKACKTFSVVNGLLIHEEKRCRILQRKLTANHTRYL